MAVFEAIASVDRGFGRSDVQAAWFGELLPTDGHASGILADSCGLLDVPVTQLENACATGNDAIRHGVLGIASGFCDLVWSWAPTRCARRRRRTRSGTGCR